jgi:hypothetical protein
MAEMFGNVKKGKVAEASVPLQDRLVSRAVRLTKGWKDLDIEGRDFAFTTPNCQWLYENSPFIRDQVLTFHQKRSNFTKPGSPNSPMPSGTESGSTTPAKAARR